MSFERWANRTYRKTKARMMTSQSHFAPYLFFSALRLADRLLADRATASGSSAPIDRPPRYVVKAESATSQSHDHLFPRGAAYDNSKNLRFNRKLAARFGGRPIRVLDLGCAGGGFVATLLESGIDAIGIDGSDIGLRTGGGEWPRIANSLFVADIAKRFSVETIDHAPVAFDCITAWEVLEHIPTPALETMMQNVQNHLVPDGIFVASVDTLPDGDVIAGVVYHNTVKPKDWWMAKFADWGFEPAAHDFETADYVRGNGIGLKNWDPVDGSGFHVVLRKRA